MATMSGSLRAADRHDRGGLVETKVPHDSTALAWRPGTTCTTSLRTGSSSRSLDHPPLPASPGARTTQRGPLDTLSLTAERARL